MRGFAQRLAKQTPAHPAPVSGDSSPLQHQSSHLSPSSEPDRGVEPDLSCPKSCLAAWSDLPDSSLAACSDSVGQRGFSPDPEASSEDAGELDYQTKPDLPQPNSISASASFGDSTQLPSTALLDSEIRDATVTSAAPILFGNPVKQYYKELRAGNVCTKEHRLLALEAARQGVELLKNDVIEMMSTSENNFIAGVQMTELQYIDKAYSLQCSQDVRRNVNKGWDLKFELSNSTYGSKENGKLIFYGPTTTIEEQGIKELNMRPDGISSLLHFTDLKGWDKELVMQWLRKPSIKHYVAELYINISTLSIRRHGGMGNTTLLQQVYEDAMIKEINLQKWVCAISNFEENERDKTESENVLVSLSCEIWERDWFCAENSYSPTNWQTEMLVYFKDSKVEPPHLDWGKPLHVVILKSAFKVFDPRICLPPYLPFN